MFSPTAAWRRRITIHACRFVQCSGSGAYPPWVSSAGDTSIVLGEEMTSTQSSGDRLTWVVRFAGDSGDGIQLQGQQFTLASALGGND
ncbi:MAG: hypothetical protein RL756_1840, partial [Pseudomonadota bacterium]